MKLDTLIRSGQVMNGTGLPAHRADIGIKDSRIVQICETIDPGTAAQVIDATNHIVSPGFIDTHAHDDFYVMAFPQCDDKIIQGVTTTIVGNCGMSCAPVSSRTTQPFLGALGGGQVDLSKLEIDTFDDYLTTLEAHGLGINVGSLIGHSAIRYIVMGTEDRSPTTEELETMKELTARAMEAGALGLSSGLIYAPGSYAATEELIELARVAHRYGGLYTTHMRSEGNAEIAALEEALRVGRETGIPVHISHHKIIGKNNWGNSTKTLKMMDDARAGGMQVSCDQFPYQAGGTNMDTMLPPTALVGGTDVYVEKLKDPEFRAWAVSNMKASTIPAWESMVIGAGLDGIVIGQSTKFDHYFGKSVQQIADEEGRDPYEVIVDIVIQDPGKCWINMFFIGEEDIVRIMKEPTTMIGSDGVSGFGAAKSHPRTRGTFPRILGRYVREKGVLSLEEGVRKMTSLPARTFGFKTKGEIREGFDADLVVFNPDTIIDRSTYDEPDLVPGGIPYVMVNGRIAVENGQLMGATSGKVLRHSHAS